MSKEANIPACEFFTNDRLDAHVQLRVQNAWSPSTRPIDGSVEMNTLLGVLNESSTASISFAILALVTTPVKSIIGYVAAHAAWQIWFSPLSRFPGPRSWGCTQLCKVVSVLRGREPQDLHLLHQKYGEVVRTGPTSLSFTSGQAHHDIYGFAGSGLPSCSRDWGFMYSTSMRQTEHGPSQTLTCDASSSFAVVHSEWGSRVPEKRKAQAEPCIFQPGSPRL
ncbi:hypothetical protein LTR27_002877 [Elasticomyces elasticus]|nr:hypothetical protein LTR27_002877 [Elasticomyces elasticus]